MCAISPQLSDCQKYCQSEAGTQRPVRPPSMAAMNGPSRPAALAYDHASSCWTLGLACWAWMRRPVPAARATTSTTSAMRFRRLA